MTDQPLPELQGVIRLDCACGHTWWPACVWSRDGELYIWSRDRTCPACGGRGVPDRLSFRLPEAGES